VGGFVENILVRVAERVIAKRAAARIASSDSVAGADVESTGGDDAAVREARAAAKERIARRGPTYVTLLALSWIMKLDVLLFGRITSGPFFALLVKAR
jgi:multidrug efflux pump subunit AcrA (membrane-fusion protein)